MGCPRLTYELKTVYCAGEREATREEKVSRENLRTTVDTGLYYYGARYYDPKVSVWLSVDPWASKYPHVTPYNFVENNPVMLVDPTGLGPWQPDGNGGWIAEKGDGAETLAQDAGISRAQAYKKMEEQGYGTYVDKDGVTKSAVDPGDVVQVDPPKRSTSGASSASGNQSTTTSSSSPKGVPEYIYDATHSPAGQFVNNVGSLSKTVFGRGGFIGPIMDGTAVISDAMTTDWRVPMEVADFTENSAQVGVETVFGPLAPAVNFINENAKDPNGITNLNNGRAAESYRSNKRPMDAYTQILMYQNGTHPSQKKK